ncbi:MAG: ABC transporter ATP-binding protein [Bacteroidales bacterium]
MEPVIRTEDLTRSFGKLKAVDAIHLEVNPGEIYGFLGLNGAGKTTMIRMLLGMIRPTAGKAWIFGKKVDPGNRDLWNRVGHLVEIPYAYPSLTVRENLEIFRRLRLIREPSSVHEVSEQLMLGPYMDTKAKNLSLGNAQRLGLAKALIHRPDLLILDEPANGLDPFGIVQIRELLRNLSRNEGVTIFISSHILGEVSRLATRIGIIHQGKMIRESATDHLESQRSRELAVSTTNNTGALKLLQKQQYHPKTAEDGTLRLKDEEALAHPERIAEFLGSKRLPLTQLGVIEEDLEHFFFRIIRENNPSL